MSTKLNKLAASAMAIPGMVGFAQAAGPAESELAYRYTSYNEDKSPEERTLGGGSLDRYKINVHQFHLLTPIGDKHSLTVEGSYEYMSGASPVYSFVPENSENVYSYFAGASKEARYDLSVAGRRYGSTSEAGANVYGSLERDYVAVNAGVDGSFQINEQMTTLSGGISAGYDWLNPNTGIPGADGEILMANDLSESQLEAFKISNPGRYSAVGKNKWQLSVFEGVGQIIDMNTVMQASLSATYKSGYLSDPYRECPSSIANGVPCDVRPSTRGMLTASVGLRKYLPNLDSAVHLDYRLFGDTWQVVSHTIDVDYYQNFVPGAAFFSNNDIKFQLAPGIRYYQQSKAFFYEIPDLNASAGAPYDENTTKFYSSDPRLSHYGALGFKLKGRMDVKQFALVGLIERYAANPIYGFNADEETPGLPGYWRFATGLNFRF